MNKKYLMGIDEGSQSAKSQFLISKEILYVKEKLL